MEGTEGGRDGFLRKFGHDGAVLWTRQFGTRTAAGDNATDYAYAVAAGPGGVFVGGQRQVEPFQTPPLSAGYGMPS